MKIPRLARKSVERLTPEITPQQEASKFASRQRLTQQVVDVAFEANNERERFELQQVDNDYESTMLEFNQTEGTQEHFSSEDVGTETDMENRQAFGAGENNEEVAADRQRIPAHEIYPDMFRDKALAEIDARANNIPKAYRADWVADKKAKLDIQYNKLVVAAAAKQKNYIRATQKEQFADAIIKRDWEGALRNALQFNGTDLERKQMKDQAYKMREFTVYDDQVSERNLPELRQSLQHLTQPADVYMKEGGRLNADERRAQIAQLRSTIGSIEKSRAVSNVAYDKRLHRDIKTVVASVENGRPMEPEYIIGILEKTKRAYDRDPDGFAIDRDALLETIGLAPSVNQVMLAPPHQRQAAVDAAVKGLSGPEKDRALNRLNAASKNARGRIDQDTVQFGLDTGLIEEVAPLNLGDPNAFLQGLVLRQHNYDKLTSQFGRATGYLSDGEANAFASFLDSASLDGKTQIISVVGEAYGDRAAEFWEQVGGKTAGPMAIAGAIAREDPHSSRAILEGHDIIKHQPDITPKTDDYDIGVSDAIGGAFPLEGQFKAVRQSVDAAYAYLSKQAGDRSGIINPKRIQEAIDMTTGGLLDMSDGSIGGTYKLVPPVRGMTHDAFDSYIRDTHQEWWREQGGVRKFDHSYKELRESIRNGKVRMVSVADNKYSLVSYITDPPEALLKKDSDDIFIFSFDEEARMIKRRQVGRVGVRSGVPTTDE